MNKSNEEIDKIIYETLSREEADFYNQLGEQSMMEMALDVYTGKDKWLKILLAILTFTFFAVFIYCTFQFFHTEVIAEMIRWLAIGLLFFGLTMSLKIWQWMQMERNAILREIRRIELQLSTIVKKMQ
ncbi:MAG: DUF6768 family protein [Bacteroidota bacterium]